MTTEMASPMRSFQDYWSSRGEWVEEPNRRRGGESGVQRVFEGDDVVYVKRQTGHIYRSPLHPFGRPTVLRERDALNGLSGLNVRVPVLRFCGAERDEQFGWKALLVTESLEGFIEYEQWIAAGGRERYGEVIHELFLKDLGENLARMHRGRWQHGCLYIKHVFIRVKLDAGQAQVEAALLDFEKCRQRFTSSRAAAHDMKQLRRHSSFADADWQKLLYFYEAAYGSVVKGLE
ncbi:lipopolysaccharide kinase InaA family protein [Pseudomonas sp. NPDC007930]|uniref:lipopolysaccharide kinase InaA family protein n=1 Tax=Pseudomonas sp. NPDC007930 TaxID=3364417 RepID=UPI0036EC770C